MDAKNLFLVSCQLIVIPNSVALFINQVIIPAIGWLSPDWRNSALIKFLRTRSGHNHHNRWFIHRDIIDKPYHLTLIKAIKHATGHPLASSFRTELQIICYERDLNQQGCYWMLSSGFDMKNKGVQQSYTLSKNSGAIDLWKITCHSPGRHMVAWDDYSF